MSRHATTGFSFSGDYGEILFDRRRWRKGPPVGIWARDLFYATVPLGFCQVRRGYFHFFLRLHGLVQTIGPTTARQRAAGELVDDHDLATPADHVVLVAVVEGVRPERLLEDVQRLQVGRVVEVALGALAVGRAFALPEQPGLLQEHLDKMAVPPPETTTTNEVPPEPSPNE